MSLTRLQRLADLLRKIYLLQFADFLWFVRSYCLDYKANNRFKKDHPGVPIPTPIMLYDIQGDCKLSGFHYGGLTHAQEISRIIAAELPDQPLKILEWGCGPARVIRHLKSPNGSCWELCGSDYNARTISWCRQHCSNVHFIKNDLEPPISADSEYFDVIYCISVFTHLSKERHQQWLTEILRLLKPGGLLISTFHGEAYRVDLTHDEQRVFDLGELVIRDKIREGRKNFSAYHCDSFVRQFLSPFKVINKLEAFPGRQTAWTAIK